MAPYGANYALINISINRKLLSELNTEAINYVMGPAPFRSILFIKTESERIWLHRSRLEAITSHSMFLTNK